MMNRLTSVPTNIAPIIAMESGFCDSSYFILQFRKRYGSTPGKFRKQS